MQEGALQAETPQLRVARAISILIVAQQGVPGEGCMHADLMRAPGRNVDLHQGRQRAEELNRFEYADRILARRGDADMPLAVLAIVGRERRVDAFGAELPAPRDQRQ